MLSQSYAQISTISSKFLGFEHIKEMYANDKYFSSICEACEHYAFHKYHRSDGFLLRENKLCVPSCFSRKLLVEEAHIWGTHGIFWGSQNPRHIIRTLLLAQHEKVCRAHLWPMYCLSASQVSTVASCPVYCIICTYSPIGRHLYGVCARIA